MPLAMQQQLGFTDATSSFFDVFVCQFLILNSVLLARKISSSGYLQLNNSMSMDLDYFNKHRNI